MKMRFLNYFDFLFESSLSYPYKLLKKEKSVDVYGFVTDFGLKYDVTLIKDDNVLIVAFYAEGKRQNAVTNNGDIFKIFSTVIDILKEKLKEDSDLDTIGYEPAASFIGDKRREKIYERGIRKNFDVINIKTEIINDSPTGYKLIKIK